MPKKNHRVPTDVKKEVLDKIKSEGVVVKDIASEYGLNPRTIYGWMSKNVTAPPTIKEMAKLRRENQALLEIIGKLTVDLTVAQKKDAGIRV